jgi:hypothetical protein
MPFVTQSIESNSRSLALNPTLVGQVWPSRAAGYYHGKNNSKISGGLAGLKPPAKHAGYDRTSIFSIS